MNAELPEFGLTIKRLKADIEARMGAIVEYLPLITTNEQWQKILDSVQPELREEVRGFLEPMLMFQVPGGLPQEPIEVRRIIYGSVEVLANAAQEGQQSENNQQQHQDGDGGGQAPEAGHRDCAEQGGEVEQEVR